MFREAALALLLACTVHSAFADDLLRPATQFPASCDSSSTSIRMGPGSKFIKSLRKFAAADEFFGDEPPVTFHLVVTNDKAKKRALDELLGRRISVVLDDFFCSEMAWHVGDAVVFKWHLPER